MATIHCENQNKKRQIDLDMLERVARITLKELKKTNYEIVLLFVSNQKIRAINRKYLNKDHSTDVISFDYEGAGKNPSLMKLFLGDIIISSDKAFQNSIEYGTTFFEEVALYVIHGILHLTGYNDISKAERATMRRKEDALLQKIKKEI